MERIERELFVEDIMAMGPFHNLEGNPGPVYRGWRLWKCGPWIGNQILIPDEKELRGLVFPEEQPCRICGHEITIDDMIRVSQQSKTVHWECSGGGPNTLVWIWRATKNGIYFYSAVPGKHAEYKKGGLFDIEQTITDETPVWKREEARRAGLLALLDDLDMEEDKDGKQ